MCPATYILLCLPNILIEFIKLGKLVSFPYLTLRFNTSLRLCYSLATLTLLSCYRLPSVFLASSLNKNTETSAFIPVLIAKYRWGLDANKEGWGDLETERTEGVEREDKEGFARLGVDTALLAKKRTTNDTNVMTNER